MNAGIIQSLLTANIYNLMIITAWIALYIWHIRNPPGSKTDAIKNSKTISSIIDLPLMAVIMGLGGTLVYGLLPGADEPLTTGSASSLLLSFMLFLSGYMALFLRR